MDSLNITLIQVLVGACAISMILLVYNFLATKLTYFRIGMVMADDEAELTEKEKDIDIRRSLSRRKCIILSERICLLLLIFESVIILLFVINSTT